MFLRAQRYRQDGGPTWGGWAREKGKPGRLGFDRGLWKLLSLLANLLSPKVADVVSVLVCVFVTDIRELRPGQPLRGAGRGATTFYTSSVDA